MSSPYYACIKKGMIGIPASTAHELSAQTHSELNVRGSSTVMTSELALTDSSSDSIVIS